VLARWWKEKKDGYAAIISQDDGLCLARVEQRGERPLLVDHGFIPYSPSQDEGPVIKGAVKSHHLHRIPCVTLLGFDDYQLLPVDALDVPQAEMGAAIRWRIRDLIDFHVDDAAVDVFDAPPGKAHGVKDKIYAVVSRNSAVQKHADRLREAGVNLEVIDIPELALRNLVARLPENAGGAAMLYFTAERGLIVLVRDSILYLARGLNMGYKNFAQFADDPAQLWDKLTLEVQRSLDYYDRHFQQAQIAHILLAPLPMEVAGLDAGLQQGLGLPVRSVRLEEVVDVTQPVTMEDAARCFLAIGAALRREEVDL